MTTSTQQALLSGIDTSSINHGVSRALVEREQTSLHPILRQTSSSSHPSPQIATDGNVNILTVRITKQGTLGGGTNNTSSSGSDTSAASPGTSIPSGPVLFSFAAAAFALLLFNEA